MDSLSHRRYFRLGWIGFFLPVALCAADDPAEKVSLAASEWVKTRAETVRLESEWAGQGGLLESLVTALGERARVLEARSGELKARTAQDREELGELGRKNDNAAAGLAGSEERLRALADALRTLRASLPPRLSAALELPYRSLGQAELPVGDRMQHTITILNRCLQFNRMVSCGEEVVLPPGAATARSLEVIYWGLSHGYAFDRAAGKVWRGAPGPQGWAWVEQPGDADAVARLIAIANDRADPDFVIVPAKLNHKER